MKERDLFKVILILYQVKSGTLLTFYVTVCTSKINWQKLFKMLKENFRVYLSLLVTSKIIF